jgi:hypothetical protein
MFLLFNKKELCSATPFLMQTILCLHCTDYFRKLIKKLILVINKQNK